MYISSKLLWMSNWKFKLRKLSNLLGQTTTRVSQQSNKCTRMSKFCNTLKVHHGRTIFFSVISDDHSCYIFFWLNAVEWYCSSSGVGSTSWFSDSGRRGLVDPALIAHVGGCGQGGCVTSLWEGCVTFIAHSWPETIVIKSVVRSQGWQRADANAISKEDLSCSINPCSSIFQLWEVNLKIWIPNVVNFATGKLIAHELWIFHILADFHLSTLIGFFQTICSDFFTCHGAKAKPPSVRRKHEKTQIILNNDLRMHQN